MECWDDDPGGIGYDYDDDTPSVDEIRLATEAGLLCCQCGEPFVRAHNRKVACRFCFARLTAEEIEAEGIRLATHDESTAAAFKRRARQKRRNNQRRASNGLGEA